MFHVAAINKDIWQSMTQGQMAHVATWYLDMCT